MLPILVPQLLCDRHTKNTYAYGMYRYHFWKVISPFFCSKTWSQPWMGHNTMGLIYDSCNNDLHILQYFMIPLRQMWVFNKSILSCSTTKYTLPSWSAWMSTMHIQFYFHLMVPLKSHHNRCIQNISKRLIRDYWCLQTPVSMYVMF